MKNCSRKVSPLVLKLTFAALVMAATPLFAGDPGSPGFYVGVDGGVNLADLSAAGSSASLDTGYRADFFTGYGVKLSDKLTVAPEFEVGLLYNSAASVVDFYQVPVLGKGILSYKFNDSLSIYGGGGAGYEYLDASVGGFSGSTEDFAWQLEAGLKYTFGRNDLGLGYKYLDFSPSGFEISNSAIMLTYTVHF